MQKISVPTGTPYEVLISRGLLDNCGDILHRVTGAKKYVIVSDDLVYPLYGARLEKAARAQDAEVFSFVFPHGEASKSHETLLLLYAFLCAHEITRSDVLLALGGGVTGDLTGYAAATFLRGQRCVQLPTTLLAQVDSSVGGKTAVNLPAGKNLVGAFHQPVCVLCDPDTLQTLPPAEIACGMAEVIKYGMIRDAELFAQLAQAAPERLPALFDTVIPRCIAIKRDLVSEDEFDTGARMLLNFGHTLGHAIERFTDFSWTHGQAVAAGMQLMSERTAPAAVSEQLRQCLLRYGLPDTAPAPMAELLPLCVNDKKRTGGTLTYVTCPEIGCGQLVNAAVSDFFQKMSS